MDPRKKEMAFDAATAFEAGDWARLESFYAADAVMTPLEGWPEPGPFTGRAEIVNEYKRLLDSFEISSLKVEAYGERGDWLVSRYRWAVKGSGSGVPQEVSFWNVSRFDGEVVVEAHFRFEHAAALAAAGLPASGS